MVDYGVREKEAVAKSAKPNSESLYGIRRSGVNEWKMYVTRGDYSWHRWYSDGEQRYEGLHIKNDSTGAV